MAAESVVKLKLESGEYESKIKRATAGLMQMERECRNAGGILNKLEDENRAFVKSLGNMETVSKSAKGKIAELTGAFQDLRSMYNRLSDEEKKGEFGKELNKQLGIMKGRIQEAQAEMKSINSEMGNGGNALDALTSKFGVNIKQLAGWGAALGVAKGALDVARDAFFNTEQGIDDYGRALKSAEGAYNTFLDTINNGNWSNFFQNISTAISASSDLYDKLDRLGSIKSNNQAAIAIEQKALADARLKLKEAQAKGDKAHVKQIQDEIKAHESRLSSLRNQEVSAGKTAGKAQITETLRSSYESQAGAGKINKGSLDKVADDLLKNGQSAFDRWKAVAERLGKKAERVDTVYGPGGTTTTKTVTDWSRLSKQEATQLRMARAVTSRETALQAGIGTYAQAVNTATQTSNDSFRYNRQAGLYTSATGGSGKSGSSTDKPEKIQVDVTQSLTDLQILEDALATVKNSMKGYGESTDEWKEMNAEVESLTRQIDILNGKAQEVQGISFGFSSSGTGDYIKMMQSELANADFGTTIYQNIQANLQDASALTAIIQELANKGVNDAELTSACETLWDKILGTDGDAIQSADWSALEEQINAKLAELNIEPIKLDIKTGNVEKTTKQAMTLSDNWSTAANMIQTAGNALNNFESPAAKIGGIIAQTVATLAAAYAQNLASDQTTKGNIWAFIAAAAAATVSLGVTIAAVKKNAEYHAQGGVAGLGNSTFIPRGTDTIPAMLTPGETILSVSQTRNLAEGLNEISETRGRDVMVFNTRMRGRDIEISGKRYRQSFNRR